MLLISVGAQTFSKWIIVLNFEIHRDYIAKNLCVNRVTPGCSCHGSCYLHKKLAQDEDQQKTPGKNTETKNPGVELFMETIPGINLLPGTGTPRMYACFREERLRDYCKSIFQPPPTLA